MKYEHDCDHVMGSLGISEEEYNRVTKLIVDICKDDDSGNLSRFIETIENLVMDDEALRRFVILLATKEMSRQARIRNEGEMIPIHVVEAVISEITGEDMKGKIKIIMSKINEYDECEGCSECDQEECCEDPSKVH